MSYGADNPFEETTSNPFEESQQPQTSSASSNQRSTSSKNKPSSGTISHQSVNPQISSDLSVTADSLRRKEQELRRREEELNKKEAELAKQEANLGSGKQRVNWPFFRPILYLNIAEEVPPEQQRLVKAAYYTWFGIIFCFIWNFATLLAALIVTGKSDYIASMILSIVYFLFFVPIFFLSFRLLYRASKKRKSSLYLMYLCNKWFEFGVIIWMGVGLVGWGGGGLLLMISLFNNKDDSGAKVVGFIALVCLIFWGILLIIDVYLFFHARVFYVRAGGFSAAKKQGAEFAAQKAAENPDLVMKAGKAAYTNA